MTFVIELDMNVTLDQLEDAARQRTPVELSAPVRSRVRASRDVLEKFVQDERVIYGVNTSMGASSTTSSRCPRPGSSRRT
ncbi:aromatic amino acid ammonia-lyase [Streptomyces albus]|nr:aromatic amino acid ammonia-lyase [Streptomyces albus]